jgi:hypothetical protein
VPTKVAAMMTLTRADRDGWGCMLECCSAAKDERLTQTKVDNDTTNMGIEDILCWRTIADLFSHWLFKAFVRFACTKFTCQAQNQPGIRNNRCGQFLLLILFLATPTHF